MKVLITGVSGQLGHDAAKVLQARNIDYFGVSSKELDITDPDAVTEMISAYQPDAILHCAAYTKVDLAEDELDRCMRVNAEGTRNIALGCREIGAKMLYVSTDYVFPGTGDRPWEIDDPTGPLNVYGRSKLAGEQAVKELLTRFFVVRTSWVIGEHGNNFVKTMLHLAETHNHLRVVEDQIEKIGVYHATNEGVCSWAELAETVFRLSGKTVEVERVSTETYGAKAPRPKNSRLSKASLDAGGFARLPKWEDALERYLKELG